MLQLLIDTWHLLEHFFFGLLSVIFLAVIAGIFSGGNTWTRFVALGFDFFWNVMTGGQIGVTISARSYISAQKGKMWGIYMSKFLGKLEPNHSQLAVQGDIDRAKAVIAALAPYDERAKPPTS